MPLPARSRWASPSCRSSSAAITRSPRPAVRGFAKANPGKKIGVINFDAHFDVRNFEHGNHNGTPFRQILEREPHIDPRNFVELGIHGFMNASTYYK